MKSIDRSPPRGFTTLGPGKDFPVLPYFLLVFASWLLWIPAGARAAGALPFPWPFELSWVGVFAPVVFGSYFVFRAGGKAGLELHLARFVHWRFPKAYWLYAIFAMPAAALAVAAAFGAFGDPGFLSNGFERLAGGDVRAGIMARYESLNYESIGLFDALFTAMTISSSAFFAGFAGLALIDGGLSEEPGWRGYAYPVLHDRWGALPAALTVGAVWALWHMGPLQWKILFAEGRAAFFGFLPGYALLYFLVVLPLAVVFGWLYESTRGSLLVCFVFHAIYNATVTAVGLMFPGTPIMFGVIGFLWATVILILVRRGWRRFAFTDGVSLPAS